MQKLLETLAITTVVTAMAVPAFAESLCYARHYDAAHLARHPDQLVTSMVLALDPEGPVRRGSSNSNDGKTKIPFDFKIAMTRRGNNNLYVQEGYVEEKDGNYRGVVECDGGGIRLRRDPSGAIVSIGFGDGYGERIRMSVAPDPCGDGDSNKETIDIERGKDDGTFRLDAVPVHFCSRATCKTAAARRFFVLKRDKSRQSGPHRA